MVNFGMRSGYDNTSKISSQIQKVGSVPHPFEIRKLIVTSDINESAKLLKWLYHYKYKKIGAIS